MKNNFLRVISLPLLSLLCLTACDPGHYRFSYLDLKDDVVSVDLIEYRNDNQKHFTSWVPNHYNELLPFEIENVTLLETLDVALLDTFLKQVCEYTILDHYYAYNSPKGTCIRLNHNNDDFTILWSPRGRYAGYIGKYSQDGEVKDFYGCFQANYIDSLIDVYFNQTQEE